MRYGLINDYVPSKFHFHCDLYHDSATDCYELTFKISLKIKSTLIEYMHPVTISVVNIILKSGQAYDLLMGHEVLDKFIDPYKLCGIAISGALKYKQTDGIFAPQVYIL